MSTGAVAGHANPRRIAAVLGRVLHDVRDAAKDVLDQVGHGVADGVPIGLAAPAIVHAGDHELAALGQLARQAAHDVFVVGGPAAAVHDDDDRQVARPLGRVDVVLERLDARLGEHDVVGDDELLHGSGLDERRADPLVLIDGHLELRRHSLVIHLPEPSRHRVPRRVERVAGIGGGGHADDRAGRVLAVRRQGR